MVTRTRGRKVTPAPVEPVILENENMTITTDAPSVDEDAPVTEATAEVQATEKTKRGRPVEALAKRSAMADYRKAEEAVELLKSKGFTVEYPERWEHPDVQSRRDAAVKAIEALKAAGVAEDEIKALLGTE